MNGAYTFADNRLISKEARDLVDQLLRNNPEERISLDTALEHEWFKILSNPRRRTRKETVRRETKKYSFLL